MDRGSGINWVASGYCKIVLIGVEHVKNLGGRGDEGDDLAIASKIGTKSISHVVEQGPRRLRTNSIVIYMCSQPLDFLAR